MPIGLGPNADTVDAGGQIIVAGNQIDQVTCVDHPARGLAIADQDQVVDAVGGNVAF